MSSSASRLFLQWNPHIHMKFWKQIQDFHPPPPPPPPQPTKKKVLVTLEVCVTTSNMTVWYTDHLPVVSSKGTSPGARERQRGLKTHRLPLTATLRSLLAWTLITRPTWPSDYNKRQRENVITQHSWKSHKDVYDCMHVNWRATAQVISMA